MRIGCISKGDIMYMEYCRVFYGLVLKSAELRMLLYVSRGRKSRALPAHATVQ